MVNLNDTQTHTHIYKNIIHLIDRESTQKGNSKHLSFFLCTTFLFYESFFCVVFDGLNLIGRYIIHILHKSTGFFFFFVIELVWWWNYFIINTKNIINKVWNIITSLTRNNLYLCSTSLEKGDRWDRTPFIFFFLLFGKVFITFSAV